MPNTTLVKTAAGVLEVRVIDATRAYVSTVSSDSIELRGKAYTVSVRFELADGTWQRVHEGYGSEPVAHRDWTNYRQRGAAPTIAAKGIAYALEALRTVLECHPDILRGAHIARAEERLQAALRKVEDARASLADAEREASAADALLTLAREH